MCVCAEFLMTPEIKRQHLRINLSIINFNSMEIQCRCCEYSTYIYLIKILFTNSDGLIVNIYSDMLAEDQLPEGQFKLRFSRIEIILK